MGDQKKIGILKNILQEELDGKKKLILFISYIPKVQRLFPKMGKKNDNQDFSFFRRKRSRTKDAAKGKAKREDEKSWKLLSKRQLKNRQDREKSLKIAEAKSPPPQHPEILTLKEEKKRKK